MAKIINRYNQAPHLTQDTNGKVTTSQLYITPGRVAQSVTCLATDASLTADPGVASSIPVRSHTFVEIDHEIKRKYVHKLLVNRLFKPAQEKGWLGELTVPQ